MVHTVILDQLLNICYDLGIASMCFLSHGLNSTRAMIRVQNIRGLGIEHKWNREQPLKSQLIVKQQLPIKDLNKFNLRQLTVARSTILCDIPTGHAGGSRKVSCLLISLVAYR